MPEGLIYREDYPNTGIERADFETKRLIRKRLKILLSQLQQDNNSLNFYYSVLNFYLAFGIKPAKEQEEWNRNCAEKVYAGWHNLNTKREGGGFDIDIEMRTVMGGVCQYLYTNYI